MSIFFPEVVYIGYIVDEHGHRPNPEKKALVTAPAPKNINELKSYLGMLKCYGRFLPKLSTALEPLHILLHKRISWHCGPRQQSSFEETKQRLCLARVLAHFSQQLQAHGILMPHRIGLERFLPMYWRVVKNVQLPLHRLPSVKQKEIMHSLMKEP